MMRSVFLVVLLAAKAWGGEAWDLQSLEKSVVFITHSEPKAVSEFALGTGFLISSNATVVTVDHHVVDETTGVVREKLFAIHENKWWPMKVARRFRDGKGGRDIAVLKPAGLVRVSKFLEVSGEAKMGMEVAIAGFPKAFGDEVKLQPLFRHGFVSSTKLTNDSGGPIIVLDMTSVLGFSGAPLVNMQTGKVIGVFFGGLNNPPSSDFSLAAPLAMEDLKGLLK
jgi:S1-C subfamily serine protease